MRHPARSLPGTTSVPQRDPCRALGKTLPENAYGAAARTVSAKTPPPLPYSCQLDQLGRHLHGSARPLHQLSKHLRGGMQIFVKAPPPC